MAEETGVDAEPEQPAVSPDGQDPSAGQRMAGQDDDDTGMQTHSYTAQRGVQTDKFLHRLIVLCPNVTFSSSNAARKEKEM